MTERLLKSMAYGAATTALIVLMVNRLAPLERDTLLSALAMFGLMTAMGWRFVFDHIE